MKMKFGIYDVLPQEAINIRTEVFVKEQGFENEFDETDAVAVHIVAFCDNSAVGVCRVFRDEESQNAYILGRLAVLKEHRNKGIGAAAVAEAEKYVKDNGGKILMLHAQCRSKNFYAKLGYEEYGGIEYDEGCPHIRMKKNIQ